MYMERLTLISCLSSKAAPFVKDMHDHEGRAPLGNAEVTRDSVSEDSDAGS